MKRRYLVPLFACLTTAAWAAPVSFPATDGQTVRADHAGDSARGVVIVHAQGQAPGAFDELRDKLARRGFHVVVVTLRAPMADGIAAARADVLGAARWLRAQGATSIALVGSEDGGNLALSAAVEDPSLAVVVLLSPRVSAAGLSLSADLKAYGARPLLLVVGAEDALGVRAASAIDGKAQGPHLIELADKGRTGPSLVTDDPQVEGRVVAWLHDGGPPRTQEAPAAKLESTDAGAIETTGTKFGR